VLDGAGTEWERERARALFAPVGPAAGLCTSGTTGLPTVVPAPWPDLLANARAFAVAAGIGQDGDGDGGGEVVWCGTPLHHRYCFAAGLLGGLAVGATVVLTPAVGPADLTTRLLDERVTTVLSVPYLYGWYLRGLEQDPALIARWSLRRCVAAGAPLPPELARRWRRVTGLPLLSHYGSTEDGQISVGTGEDDEGVGPRPARPGGAGRRHRRGARPPPGGARGAVAAHGRHGPPRRRRHLHLVGRLGDRLNIAGRKVDPTEVEDVLRTHPGVADCAVAAVPGSAGDEMAAFVVVDAAVGDAELRRHLTRVLSAYKLPRHLVRVAEVPRSRTGKVRRGALVARLVAAPPADAG
jgi:acyl-coenzyme A synthetase/AMP-(fatty) acid ligase